MKKLVLLVMAFGWTGSANADFIDLGNGTVKDDVSGLLWTKNANLNNGAQYNQAVAAIDLLNTENFGGVSTWSLPGEELGTITPQLDDALLVFTDLHTNINYATDYAPFGSGGRLVLGCSFDRGCSTIVRMTNTALGWGVSIAPVPIPAAAWLFGSALLGLIGVSRRKQA